QANGAQGLRFVHLAVAAEYPDLTIAGVGDAASMQVLQETCLVNRHQRAKTHGYSRELPEIRHKLGVWIRWQPFAFDFLTEIIQLIFCQATFQIGAAVNAGRGMALEINKIAAVIFGFGMPEMVLAAAYHGG